MCANAEGGDTLVLRVLLYLDSTVNIKAVAEYNLFGARINVKIAVFGSYKIKFPEIIATVNAQSLTSLYMCHPMFS